MDQNPIIPEKITKPIQVLGAWLAGLFAIDSCFLFAAAKMEPGSIESIALVSAAILNVPIFLAAVFLLQTKFRPELQEDSYYSTYLSQKTNLPLPVGREVVRADELFKRIELLETRALEYRISHKCNVGTIHGLVFGVNLHLEDKEKIKGTLSKHGLLKVTSFGGKEPPKQRNVSISQYLPLELQEEILKLVGPLGFESYNLYDNREEESEEDVLLGSYGEPQYELLKINDA